ncbi:hypothetical protein EDB83DRAFT_2431288 [Lactarius deliciosus]|nr:hypothetical protein EDB83DRAFT_2431288 [Lactarius deliciosus]
MSQLLLTLAQHSGVASCATLCDHLQPQALDSPGNTRPRSRYEERPGRNTGTSKAGFTFSIAASSSCGASSSVGIIRWWVRD